MSAPRHDADYVTVAELRDALALAYPNEPQRKEATVTNAYDALRASIEYCEEALRARFPATGAAVPLTYDDGGTAGRLVWSTVRLGVSTPTCTICLVDASIKIRVLAARAMPALVEALREKERAMREDVPAAAEAFTAIGGALLEEAEGLDREAP